MLKQLLQQLLNTRTTPGGAAHSASSTYTSPQWFNGTSTVGDKWTNGLYTGTASNDGYLNISGSAYITTENVGSMIQAQIGEGQISQVSPMSGQGFNMLFPISKGASFSVNGICLTDITVRFFKAIGGGYNRSTVFSFGKGENLCLKSLSPCSLIVSLRTNPSGLGVKHTLQGGLAYQLGLSNMSLQRMVGWGSISPIPAQEHLLTSLRMGQMGTLSQEKLWASLLPQVTLLSLASCLLRRATGLSLVVLSMSFGSHQQWGANSNLSTGGALC